MQIEKTLRFGETTKTKKKKSNQNKRRATNEWKKLLYFFCWWIEKNKNVFRFGSRATQFPLPSLLSLRSFRTAHASIHFTSVENHFSLLLSPSLAASLSFALNTIRHNRIHDIHGVHWWVYACMCACVSNAFAWRRLCVLVLSTVMRLVYFVRSSHRHSLFGCALNQSMCRFHLPAAIWRSCD